MISKVFKSLGVLLLVLLGEVSIAQDMGKVVFAISPDHALIKVDTMIISVGQKPKPFSVSLPEGAYPLQIWAPGMVLQEETINVMADSITFITRGLKELTPEFEAYKAKLEKYESKQFAKFGKSALILGGDILITAVVWGTGADAKEKAEEAKKGYESELSPEALRLHREAYEKYKKQYETFNWGIPVTLLAYGVSTYFIIKINKVKHEKPVFQEDNPFTLKQIGLDVDQFANLKLKMSFEF